MTTGGFSIGSQRRRAKRMIIPMLFVWTLTGLLLSLEPCCDLLTFSAGPTHAAQTELGHEHAAADHLANHGHEAGAAQTHSGSGAPQSHCKPADNPLEEAPALAGAVPGSATDAPKAPAVSSEHVARRVVALNAFATSRLQHPPSFRLHYLRTQRLRI